MPIGIRDGARFTWLARIRRWDRPGRRADRPILCGALGELPTADSPRYRRPWVPGGPTMVIGPTPPGLAVISRARPPIEASSPDALRHLSRDECRRATDRHVATRTVGVLDLSNQQVFTAVGAFGIESSCPVRAVLGVSGPDETQTGRSAMDSAALNSGAGRAHSRILRTEPVLNCS
jgi:hypothetical protein